MPDKTAQRKMFGLRMKPEVHAWLTKRSLAEDRSINYIINTILEWEMRDEQWETDDEK